MTDSSAGTSLAALDAPPEIRAAIDKLKNDLAGAAGANLAGLILYGGLARNRYRPGKSDINIVVLLRDTSTESLTIIAPILRAAWRAVRVEPFLLKPAEAQRLAETFPTKLLDIQSHHVVLMGENPFAGIQVSREQVRLRIKQSLSNLALRLRRRYLSIFDDPISQARSLADAAASLKVEFAALLQLAGKDEPLESTSTAILSAAATAFSLDGDTLARIAALRREDNPPDDLTALYNRTLTTIERAVEMVSSME